MRPMPAECTSALGGWCGGPGLPTTVLPVRPPRLFSPPEATIPGQLETAPGNGAEFAAPAVGGGGQAGCGSASVPGKRRGAHKGEAAPPGGPCRRQRGGEWREPVAAGCSRQDGVTSPHGHLGPAPPPPAVRQVSPAAGRIWAWGAAVWGAWEVTRAGTSTWPVSWLRDAEAACSGRAHGQTRLRGASVCDSAGPQLSPGALCPLAGCHSAGTRRWL